MPKLSSLLVVPPGFFRLVLASLVVISHLSDFEVGRPAVVLFFLLSGYWIFRIWHERYQQRLIWQFYLDRLLRIYPLYLLVVLIVSALKGQFIGGNLLLLGIANSGQDILGVSWSLDLELQFYALFPAFAWMLLAGGRLATSAVVAGLAVLGWWLHLTHGLTTVLQYLPAFALGSAICVAGRKPTDRTALVSAATFLWLTAMLLVIPQTATFFRKSAPDALNIDLFAMLWVVPLLPYVAASLARKSAPIDRHLGNLSYPLYIVHFPIIDWATQSGDSLVNKVIGLALALAATLVIYLVADRPLEGMRHSLAWRIARPAAPVAP